MEIRDRRSRTVIDSASGSLKQRSYITRFGLDFDDNAPPFRVGQVVDGTVSISLNAPIVIRRIRVTLECHILVDQGLERHATLTRLLRHFSDSSKHRRLFARSCVPFGDELDYADHVDEENFVLRQGQYEYLFEIPLPSDLPPAVSRQPHLSVSYVCTASVEYGDAFERAIECARLLNVARDFDLKELADNAWMLPSFIAKEFNVADFFPDANGIRGFVHVDIALPRSGVTAGQRLAFSGRIEGACSGGVDSVEALVMQVIQNPGHLSSTSTGGFLEHVVVSTELGPIRAGGVLSVDASLLLPTDHVVVPPGAWMSHSFKCTYRFVLRIALKTHAQLHILHVAAPIAVGNSFSGELADEVFP